MLIAFSDQENALEFEPRTTNTAGSLRVSSGSSIIGSVKARQEILIWTDTALYSMQFVGPPLTFAVNLINEGTGLIGPKAAVTAPQEPCLLYTSPSPRDGLLSRMPSSA